MTYLSCTFEAGSRSEGDAAIEGRSVVLFLDTGRGWDDAGVSPVVKRGIQDPNGQETHGQGVSSHVLLTIEVGLELELPKCWQVHFN